MINRPLESLIIRLILRVRESVASVLRRDGNRASDVVSEIGHMMPNVRAKLATTAWCTGQQAQNGPQAQRLMASVPRRWRSA